MQVFNSTTQYYVAAASQSDSYMAAAPGGTTTGSNLVLVNRTSALKFTVIRSTHDNSKWNICTYVAVGDNYCVNQWGNNVTQGALITAGYWSGSELTLVGSDQTDGSTFWTIQSTFGGGDKYLTASGSNVFMIGNASVANTYWKMIDTNPVANTTGSASATATGAAATSSSSSGNNDNSSGKSPLPIFIGIGVALGVIIFGVIIAFFCIRRRRKAKKAQAAQAMPLMQEHAVPASYYQQPKPPLEPAPALAPMDRPKRKPVPYVQAVEAPGDEPRNSVRMSSPTPQPGDRLLSEMDGNSSAYGHKPVYELDGSRTSER